MSIKRDIILVCVVAALFVYLKDVVYRTELPVRIHGSVDSGFEPIRDAFRENFENGLDIGAAYSVYYDGKKVVDLWGGYANRETEQPWLEDTMAAVFSVTKGVTALTMALLVERGLLKYEDPVAHYWPEFAQNGKEKVTVGHILSHQAGIPIFGLSEMNFTFVGDDKAMGNFLAQLSPLWEPGTASGYHAVTYGYLCHQILIRVDPKHRSLGRFFSEEIAKPFGLDFHIGLPLEQNYRVADYYNLVEGLGLNNLLEFLELNWISFKGESLFNLLFSDSDFFGGKPHGNSPYFRALEIPASGGIGTARSLAKMYDILSRGGIGKNGKKLISQELIKKITVPLNSGPDKMIGLDKPTGLGYVIRTIEGKESFGHAGFGGNVAFGDPNYKMGYAYVTNTLSSFGIRHDKRSNPLIQATYECLKSLKNRPS